MVGTFTSRNLFCKADFFFARALPANSKRPENPLRDGFIVEAVMLYGMTLVTADTKLGTVARRMGVNVELVP